MSKRENHWYLLGLVLRGGGGRRSGRSWMWNIALCLGLIGLFYFSFQSGSARLLEWMPTITFLVLAAAATFGLVRVVRKAARNRARYVEALAQPTPEPLLDVVEDSMKPLQARADHDANRAQARAAAFALYGREVEAGQALSEVDWSARAPMIQGMGLYAEGIIDLLCHRAPEAALERFRRGRDLGAVGNAIPGAKASRAYYDTCIAVAEALLHRTSPEGITHLEQAAKSARTPVLQLLASFGLAAAMDEAGQPERASRLRAFVRQTAPHCAAFQPRPADVPKATSPASPGPVSAALAAGGDAVRKRAISRLVLRGGWPWLALWLLLILMFVSVFNLFNSSK